MNAGDSDLCREVAAPEVAAADAAKQPVLAVTVEILGELRLLRLEVADDGHDDRIALGDFEHPEVVLDPRARLDLDRADGAERRRERAIARRQRRRPAVAAVLGPVYGAPCGRLGSKRWMCASMMGIAAGCCRAAGSDGRGGQRGEEVSAVHGGF